MSPLAGKARRWCRPFTAQSSRRAGEDVAVLNLGGISNLSLLHADGRTLGFDTGPGNCPLDGWILRHQASALTMTGAWGAQGQVLPELLARLPGRPLLPTAAATQHRPRQCSIWTGSRPIYHPASTRGTCRATLCELAARCVTDALQLHQPALTDWLSPAVVRAMRH